MKRFYIFLLLSQIVSMLVFLLCYPSTIQMQECDDLFLLSGDFIAEVLSRNQGATALIQDFVCQFFSAAWAGALIYSLLISLSILFLFLALRNLGKEKLYWLAFIPGPAIAALSFPFIDITLNFLFFTLFLYLYTCIKKTVARCIYVFIIIVPSFCFMTWYESTLLFVSLFAIESAIYKRRISAACILLAAAISLFVPRLWSEVVSFVAFSSRPFNGISDSISLKLLAVYLFTALGVAFPVKHGGHKILGYTVTTAAIAAFAIYMATYDDLLFGERTNKISLLADQKEWSEIIAEIPYDDAVKNQVLTSYLLLAQNAMGTMAQNLFSLPINNPEMFLFRHNQIPFYLNFNRQFYDNIEIWDEAFHMAFEYGITKRENDCFRAMRFKTDYAIKSKDFGTAEYYLNLLSQSCNNNDFVETRRDMLQTAQKSSTAKNLPPYRSDTFVGGYPMASETFRLFERNTKSRKLLDYVLCCLLLNKEVDKFAIILSHFNLYKDDELPQTYAEALAALASRDPKARNIVKYDSIFDSKFADFCAKAHNKTIPSEYAGTYWTYLFFRDMAPTPNNPN